MTEKNIVSTVVAGSFALLMGVAVYLFSQDALIPGIIVLIAPAFIYILLLIFKNPVHGFYLALVANFFAIGLSRYIPAPLGLTVDLFLSLTWLSLLLSAIVKPIVWRQARKDYTILVVIWGAMTFLQLFNPEAVSREAWFYAMRGQALYILLVVPLVYLIFNQPKHFDKLISICAWITLLAVAKALMQKYIGPDRWEQEWLNLPGNRSTHMLAGGLRIFSFFSDAGTFGSSMGYFGIVFTILGIHVRESKKRWLYFTVAFAAFYALIISGTRSAIAVPLTGFAIYALLARQFRILIFTASILLVMFVFLRFTTIGQSNYDIRRMRSAFNKEDASFNVRKENQRLFASYLVSRPFGGGVGSAGNWGLRFTPDTFLAQTPTDGWYIQLWAEQGIVGLSFYLLMILYFVLKSTLLIFFRLKKPENKAKAIAFTAGMYGLMVSSYTASSLGQMPNTIIVFTSITLISLMPLWEKEEEQSINAQ